MSGRAVRTRVGVNGTFVIGGLFLCGLCAQGCVSDVGELCGMLFDYLLGCWVLDSDGRLVFGDCVLLTFVMIKSICSTHTEKPCIGKSTPSLDLERSKTWCHA